MVRQGLFEGHGGPSTIVLGSGRVGLTRKRTLYFITFLALVVLSLRPVDEFERGAGYLMVPLRLAAELVAPLSWVTQGSVRAATAPATPVEEERASCAELLLADQTSARPTRSELREGRVLMHAEVVGRRTGSRDRVVVELPPSAVVRAGMPVVHGDNFVGRVIDVHRAAGRSGDAAATRGQRPRATVELVTASGFRIGARMTEAPFSRLVVGGLAPPVEGTNELMLAAHKPADRRVVVGGVEVFEHTVIDTSGFIGLANGYRLGELVSLVSSLERETGAKGVPAVRPGLDYKAGLYQLVVLGVPVPGVPNEQRLDHDPFDPAAWLHADVVLSGDPSFWREGRKLKAGFTAGIEVGAAVRSGARFVGRVVAVQALSANAALLGDRGLELPGLAWIDGRAAPFSLGRLVALGRTPEGDVRLRWEALVPLPANGEGEQAPVRAIVYTGSGERGVPRGLLVGEAWLPPGPGPHEFVLVAPSGDEIPESLEVRRAVPSEVLGP
jgi:hypothetical protein